MIFIFTFVLIIVMIALAKWGLSNLEKIKELKRSVYLLKKENIELREFIKMQDLLILEMDKNEAGI